MDDDKCLVFIREDTCPVCKSERTLEIYNQYNKPCYYSTYLDKRHNGSLDLFEPRVGYVSYIRCDRCRTKFIIEWVENYTHPRPLLYPGFYNILMEEYK